MTVLNETLATCVVYFAIERLVRQSPCSKTTSSGAFNAGEEIATAAMKIKILENIQTVKLFWRNRTTNAKRIFRILLKLVRGQLNHKYAVLTLVLPHPGPLPLGEGESSPDSGRIEGCRCFGDGAVAVPSPCGRGSG